MKFKLDEYMCQGVNTLLNSDGHDAHRFLEQGGTSAPDGPVRSVERRQERTLLTCDIDFCQLIRYSVNGPLGIIVLHGPTIESPFKKVLTPQAISHLRNRSRLGVRWIVEPGRVCEQEPPQ